MSPRARRLLGRALRYLERERAQLIEQIEMLRVLIVLTDQTTVLRPTNQGGAEIGGRRRRRRAELT